MQSYSVNCFGQTGKRLLQMIMTDTTGEAVFLKKSKTEYNYSALDSAPRRAPSRVCSIIYLFSVKYRL